MAKSKKKTEKKKVAIYIRVSTVEQSENDFSSLDAQLNKCKTWIKRSQELYEDEYQIIDTYRDTKSGKDLKRPGIARLRKDAKDGKFDLVIASKLDRVSRSLHDFLELVSELDDDGVDIAIATQDIDTSSPAGKALQRMLLVFAEFERDMISERTREKMLEAAKDGRWQGGYQPLGYDVDNSTLSVNKTEASTVKEIFRRYLKVKSAPKVVLSINKDGYRTKEWITEKGNKRGGKEFKNGVVLRILKSRLYLGQIEYEDQSFVGKHDPIIEQETYDKVQEIIKENSQNPKKYTKGSTPSVLIGLSNCGFCESSLTTTSTQKKVVKNIIITDV